jgi:hypothetical protein
MTMSMSLSTGAAWLVAGVLAALVLVLAVRVVRLGRRVGLLEERLNRPAPPASAREPAAQPEFVITHVGEPEREAEEPLEPAATVPAPVFADLVLKETVVQTASLFHGLRRALAPETRNRIRFHMRQEVKRSRKQRRTEMREVRREWVARQRAAMAADDAAGGTAA